MALAESADDRWMIIEAPNRRLRHTRPRARWSPSRGDRRPRRPRAGAGAEGLHPAGVQRVITFQRKKAATHDMGETERKLRLIQGCDGGAQRRHQHDHGPFAEEGHWRVVPAPLTQLGRCVDLRACARKGVRSNCSATSAPGDGSASASRLKQTHCHYRQCRKAGPRGRRRGGRHQE